MDVSEPTDVSREDDSIIRLVRPQESGKGLPYAPVDWPRPGDVWTWKVGRTSSVSGYYVHRFLIVPPRLQKTPTRKIWLSSKPAITRFLQSEFPKADIDAFFASFTWKIPAHIRSSVKVKSKSRSMKATSKKGSSSQIVQSTRKSTRKCVQHTPKDTTTVTCSDTTVDENTSMDQAFDPQVDFESYLNSLDDILSLPVSRALNSGRALLQTEDFTKVRKDLSSLLAMDFQSLIVSKKLPEVTHLSSKLRSDPYLGQLELSMLNLIEEIPMASKRFLDANKVTKESREFFMELDVNISLVKTLKGKYLLSKDKIALLQGEVESATSTIQEVDEHIAKLQSVRGSLSDMVKRKEIEIEELVTTKKRVVSSIPKIVSEVQMARSEIPGWEMKQKEATTEEVDILAKFAPLEGFSFMK